MRYFKYKNTKKAVNNALKEQYVSLTKDERRTVRQEKFWRRCGTVVTFIAFFSCSAIGCYLLALIPKPNHWALETLFMIGIVLLGFVVLIVSGFLAYGITLPLWTKAEQYDLPTMKKEIFSKSCKYLCDYYELQEPYIITKCYASTDEKFKNHDVCIFVVNDELRITTDLIRGFLHGHRDLGCYVFKRDEIVISKKRENNLLIVELKAEDTIFLLGYQAKRFVENSFLAKNNDT